MKEMSVQSLYDRKSSGENFILLDVREPYEHEEYNIGGTNIPLSELAFRVDEIKALGEDEIVLYCQSGNRSALAQKLLSMQFNIQNTINLLGGAKSWREIIGS
jgi:rhodanese-related sulfurtransferase